MGSPSRVQASFLLPALLLLLSATAEAQQTRAVTGQVLDQSTNRPVRDVTVRVRDTQLGAITDADGRFRLEGVPVGT